MRARPRREMRMLRRNIAAADQRDPRRQAVELEELLAGGEVLLAADAQRARPIESVCVELPITKSSGRFICL